MNDKIGVVFMLCLYVSGCFLAPSKSSINTVAYVIAVISFIFFLLNRDTFLDIFYSQKVLLTFFLITCISCFWGDSSSFFYALKASLAIMFLLFFIVNFRLLIYRYIDTILAVFVISALISSVILLFLYLSKYGVNLEFRRMQSISYGPVVQTIRTASIFSVALIIAIWLVFFKRNWLQLVGGLSIVPLFYMILLLHSRGAIVSFCIGILVIYTYYSYTPDRGIKWLVKGCAMLSLLVVFAALYALEFTTRGIMDPVRIKIWGQALSEVYSENILLGIGYSKDQSILVPEVASFNHAHNLFISVLRTTGLLGLLLFLGHLFAVVGQVFSRGREERSINALLLGWLAFGVSTGFFVEKYPVYIAPGIILTFWLPLALISTSKYSAKSE